MWSWVGGPTSVSLVSSFVKCVRIHLGKKTRSSYLEPKRAFPGFHLLKSPVGRPCFHLRGKGVGRNGNSPIFPSSTAQLIWPVATFPPPSLYHSLALSRPPGKNRPVSWGTGHSSTGNVSVSDWLGLVAWPLLELEVGLVSPEPSLKVGII